MTSWLDILCPCFYSQSFPVSDRNIQYNQTVRDDDSLPSFDLSGESDTGSWSEHSEISESGSWPSVSDDEFASYQQVKITHPSDTQEPVENLWSWLGL
jgi:hypothetical protein